MPSGFLLLNVVNRRFDPCDKSFRLSQGIPRQLKLRHQDTIFIDNNQPMALFHSQAPDRSLHMSTLMNDLPVSLFSFTQPT